MNTSASIQPDTPAAVNMSQESDSAGSRSRVDHSSSTTPATRNRAKPTRVIRVLLAAIITIGIAFGVGVAPASAESYMDYCVNCGDGYVSSGTIGGNTFPGVTTWYQSPGGTTTVARCTPGWITIEPWASSRSANSDQWISYQYHIAAGNGWTETSGFSTPIKAPAYGIGMYGVQLETPRTVLPTKYRSVNRGVRWTVYVRYAFYTAQGWSYSSWELPTKGHYQDNGNFGWASCTT